MPAHRPPRVEVVEPDDDTQVIDRQDDDEPRPDRTRRLVRRLAALVLFILLLLVLLTLVREVSYSRSLLQAQIEQGQQAARERANLLDQVEAQNARIDLLTQRLIDAGVDPASLDPDTPDGGTGTGQTGTAPGQTGTGGGGGGTGTGSAGSSAAPTTARPTTGAVPTVQPVPTGTAAPSSPAPAGTVQPAPSPQPCLLGVPGLGCVVQLPGVGLDLGADPYRPEAVIPATQVPRRRQTRVRIHPVRHPLVVPAGGDRPPAAHRRRQPAHVAPLG